MCKGQGSLAHEGTLRARVTFQGILKGTEPESPPPSFVADPRSPIGDRGSATKDVGGDFGRVPFRINFRCN